MKNLTPNQIAISACAIISVLVLFALLVLENYFVLNLPWRNSYTERSNLFISTYIIQNPPREAYPGTLI